MTQEAYVARARGSVALEYIGGKYALSVPVLLITFVMSGLNNVVFDHARLGGSLLQWFFVAVSSHLLMIIAILPARFLLLPVKDRKSRPYLTLFIFAVAGAIRGDINNLIAQGMGLQPESELIFRMVGGMNYLVLTGSLATILISVSVEHRNLMSGLSSEQQQLRSLKNSIRGQVAEQRRQILEQIHHVLDPRVSQFRVLLEESKQLPDSSIVLANTQQLVADIVRPLSHSIIESADSPELPVSKIRYGTQVKFDQARRFEVQSLILPTFMCWAVLQVSIAPLVLTLGVQQGLRVWLLAGTTTFLVLHMAKYLLDKFAANVWWSASIVGAIHVLAAIGLDLGGRLFNNEIPPQLRGYLYAFPLSLALAVMAFLIRQGQRVAAIDQTREANTQLGLLISSLRQELWINRRRLALILHGPIQGALYAAAIKLGRADTLTPEIVDEVQVDLTDALSQLDEAAKFDAKQMRTQFADISDLWFGTCNVSFSVTNAVYDILVEHPHAAECVLEIIQEGTVNAIKHGESTRIDVTIHNRKHNVLTIIMENDGVQGTGNIDPGLGSRILDEITHQWTRKYTANGVVLKAEVSLAEI